MLLTEVGGGRCLRLFANVRGLGRGASAGFGRHPPVSGAGLGGWGYLYEIDGSWEWADVESLARLGGWVAHKDRKPGKKVLARVLDWLVTGVLLAAARAAPGGRPPRTAALLGEKPDG